MSSKTSIFRFPLRAAGWMLSASLLCGCSSPATVPLQPLPPTRTAQDPPEKGPIRGTKPALPAKLETAAADKAKPADTRGLMLRGGWYRIPLTAEESPTGIYEQAGYPRSGSGSNGRVAWNSGLDAAQPCYASTGVPNEPQAKQEKTAPQVINYHYRHAGLEQLMAQPASQRAELPGLLADSDHNVAVTAAVALARQGDAQAAPRLVSAVEDENLPLPARCAAAEALGQLGCPRSSEIEARRASEVMQNQILLALRAFIDRYGQFAPGASTGYQADLHAELLRALARHIDAADDPRFIAAVQVPSALVRIETLRAWAAGTRGSMPSEIVDLRSDDDPRVRAAAIKAVAARKPPGVRDFLISALHDADLAVRLAAIRGLGRLDDAQARTTLAEVLKDRSELIRAEAVVAISGYLRGWRIAGSGARRRRRCILARAAKSGRGLGRLWRQRRRGRRPAPAGRPQRRGRAASCSLPGRLAMGICRPRAPGCPGQGGRHRVASWLPSSLSRVGPPAADSPATHRRREGLRPSPSCGCGINTGSAK